MFDKGKGNYYALLEREKGGRRRCREKGKRGRPLCARPAVLLRKEH